MRPDIYSQFFNQQALLLLCYLIGSVTFIIGLKMLSHPLKARRGNLVAAFGMVLAILATIFLYRDKNLSHLGNLGWIFAALVIGTVLGTLMAKRVQMTAMPEMVSLFNGMGGACAMLISVVEYHEDPYASGGKLLIIILGMVIGTVSFFGSMIAWGKLAGKVKDKTIPGAQALNFVLLGGIISLLVALVGGFTYAPVFFYAILVLAALYGVLFVMPIGGADMPVVISLLNSFTGVAAAFGGFLYNNPVMLTGGILVGSAGTILTILMCKAMNRSLKNVLLGAFGGNTGSGPSPLGGGREGASDKEISLSDTATLLAYAQKVMIIPGYGLAVAQAQHACHELEKALEEKGVEVTYGIHPVAGRMPGHMNVLLAEADVPYEKLQEMEDANAGMGNTDVVLVLGANDVVNPAALEDPKSPIYGMPILEAEKAKHVIVNKRSMKPGYAGIENELFFRPKTSMLFGDAKKVLQDLVGALKEV